jgi:uncharacterized protein YjbI with pentapeptide repeats
MEFTRYELYNLINRPGPLWLVRADLQHADLRAANLKGAKLILADLKYADLSDADLSGADLSGADLRWANLDWADLSKANLNGTLLIDAKYSTLTKWPDGFDPEAKFAKLKDLLEKYSKHQP